MEKEKTYEICLCHTRAFPSRHLYGRMIDLVSPRSKELSETVKMHHAFWFSTSTVTTDVSLLSLSKLNLQLIIHEECRVEVNNLRFGVKVKSNSVVFSLIKLPYFIKLARAETLGEIIHATVITTSLSFMLNSSLN